MTFWLSDLTGGSKTSCEIGGWDDPRVEQVMFGVAICIAVGSRPGRRVRC